MLCAGVGRLGSCRFANGGKLWISLLHRLALSSFFACIGVVNREGRRRTGFVWRRALD